MKAITLLQPWASLWAATPTLKLHETRSWPTKHRGPIAIHAGKGRAAAGRELWEQLWHSLAFLEEDYSPRLQAAGLPRSFDELPFGAIIATTTIEDCQPTDTLIQRVKLDPLEIELGDFGLFRYAWRRGPVSLLPTPIPAKGSLGLWDWNPNPCASVSIRG